MCRSAAQDPNNLNVQLGLGNACRILAEDQLERGQDPRDALRESIRQYERLDRVLRRAAPSEEEPSGDA